MSPLYEENGPVFQSITDRQAVLTQEKIATFPKASFPILKALYTQYSDLAKEEKAQIEAKGSAKDYDAKLSQLLACEYHLRKSPDKKAEEFVGMHKPRYNFTFGIVNDDIDELNKKIDDPTFNWSELKEKVNARDAEEASKEQEDFLKGLSEATDMTPKAENPASVKTEQEPQITPVSPKIN